MADGDVLQIVGGHQAFAAGGAGAAQQVSLLGPFPIDKDFDDGDPGAPIVLGGPYAGLLVDLWLIAGADWDVGLSLGISGSADGSNGRDLTQYDSPVRLQAGGTVEAEALRTDVSPMGNFRFSRVTSGSFYLYAANYDAPATTGTADVYALIATPA